VAHKSEIFLDGWLLDANTSRDPVPAFCTNRDQGTSSAKTLAQRLGSEELNVGKENLDPASTEWHIAGSLFDDCKASIYGIVSKMTSNTVQGASA
jgi:hypothetical protein